MWAIVAVTLLAVLAPLHLTGAVPLPTPLLAATGTRLLDHYSTKHTDGPHPRAYSGRVTGSDRTDIRDMRLAYTMLLSQHCVTLDSLPSVASIDCPAGQEYLTLHFSQPNQTSAVHNSGNVSAMQVSDAVEASERWTANQTLLTGGPHWGCQDSKGAPAVLMLRAMHLAVVDRYTLLVNTSAASVLSCMDDLQLSMNFTHVNINKSRAANATGPDTGHSSDASPHSFHPLAVVDGPIDSAAGQSPVSPRHHFRTAGSPSFSFARTGSSSTSSTLQAGQSITVAQYSYNLDHPGNSVTYSVYQKGALPLFNNWGTAATCQAGWSSW